MDVAVDETRLAYTGDGERYLCPEPELLEDTIVCAMYHRSIVSISAAQSDRAVWLAVCIGTIVDNSKRTMTILADHWAMKLHVRPRPGMESLISTSGRNDKETRLVKNKATGLQCVYRSPLISDSRWRVRASLKATIRAIASPKQQNNCATVLLLALWVHPKLSQAWTRRIKSFVS